MNIYGCHFTYAGVDSTTYSLMIANLETKRDERIAGDVTGEYIYRKSDKTFRLLGDTHRDSQMVFEVEIITDDSTALSQADRRAVEKWLFNKQTFRKLYINQEDDPLGETYETVGGNTLSLYMACRFINPEKIDIGCGVIGYKATIECDSGFLWQDESTVTHSGSGSFTVDVDTDINDYTYPQVTITTSGGCTEFSIYNSSDDSNRRTTFSGLSGNDSITMNGSIGYVDSNHYSNFDGLNFLRLLDGSNTINCTSGVNSVTIKWNNRRFF